ncbi:hypothetical protein K4K58_008670 [Colletotrichum sp. SAR11_239]|nr:hypothetical protein K4K58_008670 [Colletotrichum sp. SAR11_239]
MIGMSDVEDIWAGTMVWVCVIVGALFVLIQLGFFFRWVFRLISNTPEEDLRAKNIPFSVGNIVRVVFNYLLLPIVALSTFQLVVAGQSQEFAVALAVITLIILICFAAWLLYLIFKTRPRAVLFDDLPTVLLYGPLYNTYSDEAAAFALIPVILTFIRGITIGAVQPVGIAQIVILAICEAQLSRGPTPAPQAINLTPRADYSTREVDFYYGVRGPALNSEGVGRKLGTGPADPTGPMSSAAGWFRNFFGGKTKEKGKGFEVVRSSRMPPAMRAAADAEYEAEPPPEGIPVAMGVLRNGPIESDDDEPKNKATQKHTDNMENAENSDNLLNDDGVSVVSSDSEIETKKLEKGFSRAPWTLTHAIVQPDPANVTHGASFWSV